MVCKCNRTLEDARLGWLLLRRLLEVGSTDDSSWRVSNRETNCATVMVLFLLLGERGICERG
jgi:hypothetical protein